MCSDTIFDIVLLAQMDIQSEKLSAAALFSFNLNFALRYAPNTKLRSRRQTPRRAFGERSTFGCVPKSAIALLFGKSNKNLFKKIVL